MMGSDQPVRALVAEIRTFRPRETDVFLIDTNVWFWMCYPAAPDVPGAGPAVEMDSYSHFLKEAALAGAKIVWSPFSWAELAHSIEHTEFEIAKKCGVTSARNLKEFRNGTPEERNRVVEQIQSTWSQVVELAQPLRGFVVGEQQASEANLDLPKSRLDGYDHFLAQSARDAGVTGVVTADADFISAAKLTVLTANQRALKAATAAGRLMKSRK